MNKAFWMGAAMLGTAALLAGAAHAANPPTLHGFCSTAKPCADNGTNTPTSVNPPQFGFSAGGKTATGVVFIDILVPDNEKLPASYTLSGPFLKAPVTASLYSKTPWTSGDLDSYLHISASPADPIGGYLPATQKSDSGADGFDVYVADIGTVTLPTNSGATKAPLMTIDSSLFTGSYIVAFIKQGDKYGTNSNSGAILETGSMSGTPEPATWAMMLAGFGLVGAMVRRRGGLVAG